MRKIQLLTVTVVIAAAWIAACSTPGPQQDYAVQPVEFRAVRITDDFWAPRIRTNREVTIRSNFDQCERTGRVDNFVKAAGKMEGAFVRPAYNDTDVYKTMEGASYSLSLNPDPELEQYLDDLVAKIAAAQEEDGYLFTERTIDPENTSERAGPERWSNLEASHELYNAGHMYEAAVAHYQATGKRTFLDVAIKNADLICRTFGPGKNPDVPGHQEIEIGLVKLYRVTGDKKYLDQAKFFLDGRGHIEGRTRHERSEFGVYGYTQDHMPVVEQSEAVGHAVRAGYMYAGMADVAALTGDQEYLQAMDRLWANVVGRKMYLTGGIGARHRGESFGDDYELPNDTAYNETCAAIANIMWNHRLFLLHGEAKYVDVLERVLYNGYLSGVSLSGNTFFYPNPLSWDGMYKFNKGSGTRQEWFRVSCCPGNVSRFMPSIRGYVYAQRDDNLYVNLYVGGDGNMEMGGTTVRLFQETRYPWDGSVKITVAPGEEADFAVHLRIPGWAQNRPVPSDLYRYATRNSEQVTLKVNGEATPLNLEKGYARIQRNWREGDIIELNLPMPIRRVLSHEKVEANKGRVALERGPIVYCVEAVDNGGRVSQIALSEDAKLGIDFQPELLGGVTVIEGDGLKAIPYYSWAHRGEGEMAVWLPSKL